MAAADSELGTGEPDRKKELLQKRMPQLRGQLRQLRRKTAGYSNPRVRWFDLQQKFTVRKWLILAAP
jgi:hypothetical protein